MTHTHISKDDWSCISKMLKAGHSGSEVARTLGKDASSVNRHIAKYGGRRRYDVNEVRRQKQMGRVDAMDSIRVIKGGMLRFIKRGLIDHKSPEQISGVLRRKGTSVSASTIYRYIKERASHLTKYLRSKKGKYRRRRGTKIREIEREKANKRRVDERPAIIERRGRIGDFEGDTVMGRDKRVRIVTFVDRRTGYLVTFLLPRMNACLVTSLTLKHFRSIPRRKRRTITFDNGIEFSDWRGLEERSKMIIYFCYPYHSWERGTNENTNGLLRQYFPKTMDFNLITPDELTRITRKLNNRPRKRLGFLSPRQMFWKR